MTGSSARWRAHSVSSDDHSRVYSLVLWAIVGASMLHVGEEYLSPGGFLHAMREIAPGITGAATPRFAALVNGAFLMLVVVAASLGERSLLFSLSIAALVGVNGAGHCLGSLRLRRYMPGTLTGAALYVPLCVTAYAFAIRDEDLALGVGLAAAALGLGWNAVPALYLLLHTQLRRPRSVAAEPHMRRPPQEQSLEACWHHPADAVLEALASAPDGLGSHLAADLVQDTFVRALEKRASFRGDSVPATWLHRILHNLAIDRARRASREIAVEEVEERWRDDGYSVDAAVVVERAQTREELEDALVSRSRSGSGSTCRRPSNDSGAAG